MNQAKPYRGRSLVVAFVLVLGFGAVLSRLIDLQVLQAAKLGEKAEQQHHKAAVVEGRRGGIYDRQGRILAMNMEVPSVYGVPTSVEYPGRVARDLTRVLPVRADEIERKLRQKRNFVWIARKLDPEKGRRVEGLSLRGIGTVIEGRRFYPKGPLLSHVLGFAGLDGHGLEGIERRYESTLRGHSRRVILQRDALGRTVFPKGLSELGPHSGNDISLTIDEVIQYIAEKELLEAVNTSGAKGGVVIVMEPTSGAVLAMAVNPRFDPNAVRSLSADSWRNRAVTDAYEPGSTLKIVIAAAALEEKLMTPSSLVFAENGRMRVANTVIHDHEKSGWLTFADVIRRSSNIGAVKIATRLGEERVHRYLRAFGFGERTEIDLPGETAGLVKSPEAWGERTLASIAIGQGIGVTAVQLATAVSAVANGGWLMKPYIVSAIRDRQGRLIAQVSPQVRRRPITAETARVLSKILESVVKEGTGRRAAVPPYRVAGKTGTAQKYDLEANAYSSTRFVASFVGYAPARDPRLTIVVVIDEPQGEAWGGVVAAPVFRRVAEQVLPYLGISSHAPAELAFVTTG